MKVIVFGANGGLGQTVWKAAVDAGHTVVAFVRSPAKLDSADRRFAKLQVVAGNALDAGAVQDAAQGCEAMVNCTSPAGGDATLDLARSVVTSTAAAGVETFYMVGGLGALWVPGTQRQVLVQDWDDVEAMKTYGLSAAIPKERIQAMTRGHLRSMAFLESTGHPHTFICPGGMFDGPESPDRVVTLDELGGHNAMRISYADVARVIVDDLGRGELLGHRVCVAASR